MSERKTAVVNEPHPTTALAPAADAELVAPDQYKGLHLAYSPAEAARRLNELQAFVKMAMVPGVDYGEIAKRRTLLQPGAQKLAELYGFAWSFEDVEVVQRWEEPAFFLFRKRCVLTSRRDGKFIGDGVGSCNSREDKYGWRWVDAASVPPYLDKNTLLTRREEVWYFRSKIPAGMDVNKMQTRRVASKFPDRDATDGKATQWGIVAEQVRIPNPDVYSIVNTLEKMACKRALIHAVIGGSRSAGLFTQDLEDLPPEAHGRTETPTWERESDPNTAGPTEEQIDTERRLIDALADAGDAGEWKRFNVVRDEYLAAKEALTADQRTRILSVANIARAKVETAERARKTAAAAGTPTAAAEPSTPPKKPRGGKRDPAEHDEPPDQDPTNGQGPFDAREDHRDPGED